MTEAITVAEEGGDITKQWIPISVVCALTVFCVIGTIGVMRTFGDFQTTLAVMQKEMEYDRQTLKVFIDGRLESDRRQWDAINKLAPQKMNRQ
jgi:hypothetical protein